MAIKNMVEDREVQSSEVIISDVLATLELREPQMKNNVNILELCEELVKNLGKTK